MKTVYIPPPEHHHYPLAACYVTAVLNAVPVTTYLKDGDTWEQDDEPEWHSDTTYKMVTVMGNELHSPGKDR